MKESGCDALKLEGGAEIIDTVRVFSMQAFPLWDILD